MMHAIFQDFFRSMGEAPRIAREARERAARECGVCAECGRPLEAGRCGARNCPAVRPEITEPSL